MTQAALSLSLARIISQGLVAETAADNPIAAVDNMLALQAQLPSSIPWAINLRVKQPSIGAINEAFESAELVRSWPMRGTILSPARRTIIGCVRCFDIGIARGCVPLRKRD